MRLWIRSWVWFSRIKNGDVRDIRGRSVNSPGVLECVEVPQEWYATVSSEEGGLLYLGVLGYHHT